MRTFRLGSYLEFGHCGQHFFSGTYQVSYIHSSRTFTYAPVLIEALQVRFFHRREGVIESGSHLAIEEEPSIADRRLGARTQLAGVEVVVVEPRSVAKEAGGEVLSMAEEHAHQLVLASPEFDPGLERFLGFWPSEVRRGKDKNCRIADEDVVPLARRAARIVGGIQ